MIIEQSKCFTITRGLVNILRVNRPTQLPILVLYLTTEKREMICNVHRRQQVICCDKKFGEYQQCWSSIVDPQFCLCIHQLKTGFVSAMIIDGSNYFCDCEYQSD